MKVFNEARFEPKHFPEEWGHTGESDVEEGVVLSFSWDEFIDNGDSSRVMEDVTSSGVHIFVSQLYRIQRMFLSGSMVRHAP